jgi:hypothetical protein
MQWISSLRNGMLYDCGFGTYRAPEINSCFIGRRGPGLRPFSFMRVMRIALSSFLQVPQCRQDLEPDRHCPALVCNCCQFCRFTKAYGLRPRFLFPIWERIQFFLAVF